MVTVYLNTWRMAREHAFVLNTNYTNEIMQREEKTKCQTKDTRQDYRSKQADSKTKCIAFSLTISVFFSEKKLAKKTKLMKGNTV